MELLLPKEEPVIHLNFSWFEKPATRMPEALWLTFHLRTETRSLGWRNERTGTAGASVISFSSASPTAGPASA